MANPQQDQQTQIDELLERYLSLLDTYSALRKELSALQSGIYQGIARANFAGERGMRYGADQYDERMRAVRMLGVEVGEGGVPVFRIENAAAAEEEESSPPDGDAGDDEKEDSSSGADPVDSDKASGSPQQSTAPKKQTKKPNDPLRWFGLFAPPALRAAQAQSIRAVEDIIPRLVSVNAEMASIEIQVRRARKRRAKSALAAEREALAAPSDVAVEGKNV